MTSCCFTIAAIRYARRLYLRARSAAALAASARGLLLPGTFIRVAEITGLIVPISVNVLHKGFRQMKPGSTKAWRRRRCRSRSISRPLRSRRRRSRPTSEGDQDFALPPERLELEVTGPSSWRFSTTADVLTRLQRRGVKVAVRRFRHRLFVAGFYQMAARHRAQDRAGIRRNIRRSDQQRGDPRGDRDGARDRHRVHRQGRRARGSGGISARSRLLPCPGIALSAPNAGSRRSPSCCAAPNLPRSAGRSGHHFHQRWHFRLPPLSPAPNTNP